MKVLIITYYWPPSGGSGVQRWLKFVKYLRNFNVEPVVYTADNPKYAILDETLQNEIPTTVEVLKQPIKEPNNILAFFGKKSKRTTERQNLQGTPESKKHSMNSQEEKRKQQKRKERRKGNLT